MSNENTPAPCQAHGLDPSPPLTVQGMVENFHYLTGSPVALDINQTSFEEMRLRMDLIKEETIELGQEMFNAQNRMYHGRYVTAAERESMLKEMADLVYVIYGTAVTFGFDLDEAVRRVHQSNMSKLVEVDVCWACGREGTDAIECTASFLKTSDLYPCEIEQIKRPLKREDGKVLKGPNYESPNLEGLV